jgi:uncharacterized protein (DUF433 family)
MQTLTDIGTLIVQTPGVCGGRPRIAGHRITVQNIAIDFNAGMKPEDIISEKPYLTLAQVYASLAYYYANQKAIALDVSQPSIEPAAPVSQTVADQAKTLAWLTGRVEALEAEINQLQQEKQKARCLADTARVATNLSLENEQSQQEINQLHDENNRLKTELLQTQSRMEGIQRFLNGGAVERTTSADAIKTQAAATTALPTPQKVSNAVSSQADLDPDVLRALQAVLDYNEYEVTSYQ